MKFALFFIKLKIISSVERYVQTFFYIFLYIVLFIFSFSLYAKKLKYIYVDEIRITGKKTLSKKDILKKISFKEGELLILIYLNQKRISSKLFLKLKTSVSLLLSQTEKILLR